ncbi:MAG: hypothetical protein JWM30_3853 [Burkholderia sp.]|nr:hypothetical protein [Burkholderia sp.]
MLLFQLLNRQCRIQGDLTTLADPWRDEIGLGSDHVSGKSFAPKCETVII